MASDVLSRSVASESATPWTAARQDPLSMGILQATPPKGLTARRREAKEKLHSEPQSR